MDKELLKKKLGNFVHLARKYGVDSDEVNKSIDNNNDIEFLKLAATYLFVIEESGLTNK